MEASARCSGTCSASGRAGTAPIRLQAPRRPFQDGRHAVTGPSSLASGSGRWRAATAAAAASSRPSDTQLAQQRRRGQAARRSLLTTAAAAPPSAAASTASSSAAPSSSGGGAAQAVQLSEERGARLESMIQLRKLYRNILRAEALVQQPRPVYQPPEPAAAAAAAAAAESQAADAAALAAAADDDAQRRLYEAVEVVAEMELTAEQMKAGLRSLRASPFEFPLLFRKEEQAGAAEALEERVAMLFDMLADRAAEEVALLPFASEAAAHAAIDARNARYRLSIPWNPAGGAAGEGSEGEESGGDQAGPGLSERLVKAEKAAEQFVARRLQPAVQRVKETSPEGVVEGLKTSAVWAKGLWSRLNGAPGQPGRDAPVALPLPTATEEARKQQIQQLNLELDGLEKKLQEASKARETRLRKAGIQGRARMASELRDMDNDIAALSKALAVRTLQLEMEYVHGALEEEARDITGDSKEGADLSLALSRRGSSDEVALLVAEFRLLDEQLAGMAAAVEGSESLFIDDSELARLATDVPDLRVRLGIGESEVFGSTGFSIGKLQMQIRESVVKVVDGVSFGVRGVKLLFADIGAAGKLFWRAVRGGTLKPREVQALRRTVKDLLTFVPFTIILIIPLTPVGHVLIFGFIQRYFPGFFPSQFTGRRQDLMRKYDELKRQLRDAELQAEAENDEMDYQQKATAAMAALGRSAAVVAPAAAAAAATALGAEVELAAAAAVAVGATAAGVVGSLGDNSGGGDSAALQQTESEEEEGPAAKAVRQIEEKLVAAEDDAYTGDVEEQAQATDKQQEGKPSSGGAPPSAGH